MQPITINNGLCVVCNNKRYRPYSSTCTDCYRTTNYKTVEILSEKESEKANDKLFKERKDIK